MAFGDQVQALETAIMAIDLYRGIDSALAGGYSQTLDDIGAIVGCPAHIVDGSPSMADSDYAVALRVQILINASQGEPERLIAALQFLSTTPGSTPTKIDYWEQYVARACLNVRDPQQFSTVLQQVMDIVKAGGVALEIQETEEPAFIFGGDRMTDADPGEEDDTDPYYSNGEGFAEYYEDWTARDSARAWKGVASSATGQYQLSCVNAGYIYVSSDYGVTWTQKAVSGNWTACAMSSDGHYQVVVGETEFSYYSTDYGATWIEGSGNSRPYRDVACSADGSVMCAATNAQDVWYSLDHGNNWAISYLPGSPPVASGITISNDGLRVTLVCENGHIFTAVAGGMQTSTWTDRNVGGTWRRVAMSGTTGQYQVAVQNVGHVYISNDYGATWNLASGETISEEGYWTGAAVSADGSTQIVCRTGQEGSGVIMLSKDYGQTWTMVFYLGLALIQTIERCAMSSDGKRLVAVVTGDTIITSFYDTYGGNFAELLIKE